jgi:tetratricopeptide (TPR) repeat protein
MAHSWIKKIQNPALLFWLIALGILLIMLSVYPDYGLTEDEPIHQLHGEVLLEHYTQGDTLASQSPIDSAGNLIRTTSTVKNESTRGMNFFGGFYDLVINALYKYSDLNIYDFRHKTGAFVGFLIFVFIGLTTKELSNWKVAILALLMAALSPRLWGHSFANPKDIPFAALYMIAIYLLIRFFKKLPQISIWNLLLIALSIGVSISIRVSGLLLVFYLVLAWMVYWGKELYERKIWDKARMIRSGFLTLVVAVLGYFISLLFWPYAATDYLAPFKVLSRVSDFEIFNAHEIFQGKWYNRGEVPWHYPLTWIWISIPLFLNIGILMMLVFPFLKAKKDLPKWPLILLGFFFLFPIAYIILKQSYIYNGIRHLLFIFPPLIVLSALLWNRTLQLLKRSAFYYAFLILLVAGMLQALVWGVKAHPYQSMYFSPLVGGNLAVYHQYETDYWGLSTKEAVEWIKDETDSLRKERPVYIKMYYGTRIKVLNYIDSVPNLRFLPGDNDTGWDYEIVFLAAGKFNPNLRWSWPPKNTLYEIQANGLPLAAVVQSPYFGMSLQEIAEVNPTAKNYINLSLDLYYKNDFVGAYNAAKKAWQIEPENAVALNNMGSAANAMELYELAYIDLTKSLRLKPDFANAKNNLKIAQEGKTSVRSNTQLLKNSVNAYFVEAYYIAEFYAKTILDTEPQNAFAWNNLCSALNAQERYQEAIHAGEMALKYKADFQLAKNNLAWAKSKLKP